MNKRLIIGDEDVSYRLKLRSGQRSIRMRMNEDGSLTISGPLSLSTSKIPEILNRHLPWIKSSRLKLGKKKKIINDQPLQALRLKTQILVRERLAHYNQFYNFLFRSISVSTARTRWGSCSRNGNLSFSYKLGLLPDHLIDYVVVHELCHLKEHNHSSSFWKLVAVHVPDHKERRRELRSLLIEENS